MEDEIIKKLPKDILNHCLSDYLFDDIHKLCLINKNMHPVEVILKYHVKIDLNKFIKEEGFKGPHPYICWKYYEDDIHIFTIGKGWYYTDRSEYEMELAVGTSFTYLDNQFLITSESDFHDHYLKDFTRDYDMDEIKEFKERIEMIIKEAEEIIYED